jgi:hypothetical protein
MEGEAAGERVGPVAEGARQPAIDRDRPAQGQGADSRSMAGCRAPSATGPTRSPAASPSIPASTCGRNTGIVRHRHRPGRGRPRRGAVFRPQVDAGMEGEAAGVDGGLSSTFGYRSDPFTRGLALHTGIDLRSEYGAIVTVPAAVARAGAPYSDRRSMPVWRARPRVNGCRPSATSASATPCGASSAPCPCAGRSRSMAGCRVRPGPADRRSRRRGGRRSEPPRVRSPPSLRAGAPWWWGASRPAAAARRRACAE